MKAFTKIWERHGCSRGFWKRAAQALATAAMLAACDRAPAPQAPQPAPTPQHALPTSEQSGMVGAIVRDIAAMAVFAKDRSVLAADAVELEPRPADASGYHYTARVQLPGETQPVSLPVDIAGSVWEPAAYQPAAQALLEKLALAQTADDTTVHESAVRTLAVPLAKTIQQENERVSAMLNAHPLAPEAHEQAALIAGVLGIRENSGAFWHPVDFCNRTTAHLALARALRGAQPLSDAGEIAGLLTSLEADTKKDSEERIARLRERNSPDLAPWINAALLRNRRDWRVLEKRGTASLLERIEYFRAKCNSVSPDIAADELTKTSPEQVADWCNILLQFDFSVDTGHRFTPPALKLLIREMAEAIPESRQVKVTPENLARILNREPGCVVQKDAAGEAKILPIDSGMWALFFQRHFIHAAVRTDYFLREGWGVPDEAAKFEESVGQLFSKLTLTPFLHVLWNSSSHQDRTGDEAAEALTRQHPEWIPATAWGMIRRPSAQKALAAWFSPGLPAGTAYDFVCRRRYVPEVRRMDTASLQKLREIAPWQYGIAETYLKTIQGSHPSPEQARAILEPYLEFHHAAMGRYASYVKENVPEYTAIYERMAKLDPDQYMNLWEYYRDHHMDDRAAEAFQAALDHDADAVWVANESGWMVNYCYDRGEKDRALKIAENAAEVYSYRGLEAMAWLQERMGDTAQAESYFQKIEERYKDNLPLLAFYLRQVPHDPQFAAKMKQGLAAIFPEGVQTVALENFTAAPQKGVRIDGENALLVRCGLKKGDIIVALDGKRVQSFKQYQLVRNLTDSPSMDLIVYHEGAYKQVKAEVPGRRFGLDFTTWP